MLCLQVGCAMLTGWVCHVDRLGMLCREDTWVVHPTPHQQYQVAPAGDGDAGEAPPRTTARPHPRPGVPCHCDALL